uniref:Phosphatase and actin regulator n=1 Tax=Anoplophora glabripennis TaxID=217634 RepID=V5GP61_ANOGL
MAQLLRRFSGSKRNLSRTRSRDRIDEECSEASSGGTCADDSQNTEAKKQNGSAFRTNSLGSGTRTPPAERKSKFSIGKLLRPWKWKRKRKSDKLEAVSRTLERKISVRANRDDLVLKGILLPESPLSPPKSEPGETVPSPFPPSGAQQVPGGQTPQGQPPPYPIAAIGTPSAAHLPPISHALLQQQLLQNPHFTAQANANNNHTGKLEISFLFVCR